MTSQSAQQSCGDQLIALAESLKEKKAALDARIEKDEETKDGILKEMKALTAKLEENEARLAKMLAARKEYMKTIQECDFALQKIEETAGMMAERFSKLDKVQIQV